MVRVTLDLDNPPQLSPKALAALDALTHEDIEENARTDPDNPPMTADELERVRLARAVQLTRQASGFSQAEFSARYQIDLKQLEGWERGLLRPDTVVMAYLQTIRREPEAVARALNPQVAA